MRRPGICIAVLVLTIAAGCATPAATGERIIRHGAAAVLRVLLSQIAGVDAAPVREASSTPLNRKLDLVPAVSGRRVQPAQVCDLRAPSTRQQPGDRRPLRAIVSKTKTVKPQSQALVCSTELGTLLRHLDNARPHIVVNRDGEILGGNFVIEVPEPPALTTPIGDGRA